MHGLHGMFGIRRSVRMEWTMKTGLGVTIVIENY
jgi:hypothetical protein